MNPLKLAAATLAAILILATVEADLPPIDNDDMGSGLFGFEPDPPEVEPPSLDIVASSLNTITSLDVSGLAPGDSMLADLGGSSLVFQYLEDGSLVTQVVGDQGINSMTLPPIDGGSSDFLALITPVSVAIDRVGDNPVDLDNTNIVDGTLMTYGLIDDLGSLGEDGPVPNPPELQAPGNVQAVADKIDLANPLDGVMEFAVVDPENNLVVKTLQEHSAQVPLADTVYSTPTAIKTQLDSLSLTGLSLNNVLSGLSTATKQLGAVDTALLGAQLNKLGYGLQVVDLPINDPATLLDPTNGKLILVDGGLGKMAMVGGADKLVFDNNLVTALKDSSSTELTSFVTLSKLGDKTVLGKTFFHPTLGNYGELLQKTAPLNKNGITSSIMPPGVSCKNQLTSHAAGDGLSSYCMTPNDPAFPVKGASMMGGILNPAQNPKLADTPAAKSLGMAPKTPPAPGLPGGPAAPGESAVPKNLGMGTPAGHLKDFPAAKDFMDKGGALTAFSPSPPSLDKYAIGDWAPPAKGFGALPDVEAPNPDAVKELKCTGSCLPSTTPALPDAAMESFGAPAMPGVAPVVPTDGLAGVTGMVMGASGSGLALLPADLLKGLPVGLTSEKQFRFIGQGGSIYGNTGIPEVTVQVETTDALGLAKNTASKQTNTNGYATFAIPSLGSYKVTGSKEGFNMVSGAGQAPAPGQTSGQEFTMSADSGNGLKDGLVNNGANFLMFLLIGGLVAAFAVSKWKKRKAKRGGAA